MVDRPEATLAPDPDIVLIKNRGITYPEHFPAYSIGDGKLIVNDLRDRAQLIMKLSNRQTSTGSPFHPVIGWSK